VGHCTISVGIWGPTFQDSVTVLSTSVECRIIMTQWHGGMSQRNADTKCSNTRAWELAQYPVCLCNGTSTCVVEVGVTFENTARHSNVFRPRCTDQIRNDLQIHFNMYDVFYSLCSHQHVSAGIPAIFRVMLLLQEYKTLHLTAAGVPTRNISCIFGHKIKLVHACLWSLLLIIPISSLSCFYYRKYDGTWLGKPLTTAMLLQPLQ